MIFKRILFSIALMAAALGVAHAVNITGVNSSGSNRVNVVGFVRYSVTDTITAFAGGGQTSAVLLTSAINRVSTVASGNDSVKLPLCRTGPDAAVGAGQPVNTIGQSMYVINAAAANSMNVFPSSGGSINALSADAAYAVAANKTVEFVCIGNIWYSILGS
jgi:hypothetical protein